ncbi:acylneuraminate cytidylyltransferase family protein [Vibrio sp. S9_S30]|uniref:acylneuraminate cytidylyltransferase family protein n=1 Tax=Vibrio sp. S9_S30 TaxID=2720226 RepID=UPI001680ABB5|nr:acylneuraminate cytidylyltransferase family protein [Vibrio sp. S9_S30]MBD1558474.1 acylneuraminate cytidylyltransferase family protein [Vibrio sp. S9_S30]
MLAIIPARGGSKGLPGKNTRMLCDKPMIGYSIQEALKSRFITDVIVSTDDQSIYDLSIELGAKESFLRPAHLAADDSIAIDNYKYTLKRLENSTRKKIDSFVVLQPTSPLRIVEDIDGAIDVFLDKDADSVISYCREDHPIFWHKFMNENGMLESVFSDERLANRQEYRESYYPNGAVYVFKHELVAQGLYHGSKTFPYIMPRSRSVDIDTLEDFEYAEYLMRKR